MFRSAVLMTFTTVFVAVITLTGSTQSVFADTTGCPSNAPPATAADVPLMIQAGIVGAKVGMCWDRNNTSVGADQGQAKQYLSSILCKPDGDNYGGMGPQGTIQNLDGKFAVCAAGFLKAASAQQQVCVREGARTVAKQNEYVARGVKACKKGALCEHPRGVAIDVNVVGAADRCNSYTWLHQMAPQFGLIFYLGCQDSYHFVPQKGGCNSGGTTPADGTIPASSYDFPSDYSAANQLPQNQSMPWQGITNALKSASSPQSPGSGTTLPSQPQTPSLSCTPQNICAGSTLYFQPASCITQIVQVCPYGCAGTVCAVHATTTSATSTGGILDVATALLLSSQNQNANQSTSPLTSVLDTLTSFASPISNSLVTIGNAAPIALGTGLFQFGNSTNQTIGTPDTHSMSLGAFDGAEPTANTFTSSPTTQNLSSANTSSSSLLLQVLDTLKAALISLLHYLLPSPSAPTVSAS